MFIGTIEDNLINACERLGYGLDMSGLGSYVEINTGDASRRHADRHYFRNATAALMWVEAREQAAKDFAAR